MRQVLFHIPLDRPWHLGPLGDVQMFGLGLLLLLWTLLGGLWLIGWLRQSDRKVDRDEVSAAVHWFVIAAALLFAPYVGAYLRVNGSAHFREGMPVFGYGLMLFIGMASAIALAIWRAKREGVPGDLIWDMAFFLFLGGIAGGRIFYLVQKAPDIFPRVQNAEQLVNAIFNLSEGGLVLYGALLAGAAAFFAFCHYRRVHPLGLADVVAPSVFVGIGFGRIGCFLNGCCYGDVCNLPWAVQFPRGSATFDALLQKGLIAPGALWTPPLHPTQLYSALDGFLIAALTTWYFSHRRRNGEVLAVGLTIYPITRFLIEILRNDEGGQLGTSLTISQCVSIALFAAAIGYWVWLSRRPAVREPIALPADPSTERTPPHRASSVRAATR